MLVLFHWQPKIQNLLNLESYRKLQKNSKKCSHLKPYMNIFWAFILKKSPIIWILIEHWLLLLIIFLLTKQLKERQEVNQERGRDGCGKKGADRGKNTGDRWMDGWMDGSAEAAPSPSFHVLIYSVWLIPFTPAAGAIPLDVHCAPPPSSHPPPCLSTPPWPTCWAGPPCTRRAAAWKHSMHDMTQEEQSTY